MNLLAFDTSTEVMGIALSRTLAGTTSVWEHTGVGGAQASTHLIAQVMALLQQANLPLKDLDAICFGAGPGSFTGLRTACAVAQGLAYGAGVPVLAVDSLLAVAEEARFHAMVDQPACRITALLDARMDEMYIATWAWDGVRWTELAESALLRPEDLQPQAAVLAGNVFGVYARRLGLAHGGLGDAQQVTALPTATAMLRVAPQMLAAGLAVDAAQALPRYIRDKVAETTAERDHKKALARDATEVVHAAASY
jgi:tRNA threonylcarbamoyladenosine biosynthesis protein TsaB